MANPKKKVLIVDDESDVREFIQAVLEDGGYEFVTACDGEEGLATARAERPDLAILDVQMPKMDGFELFAELRKDKATQSIPIIMLTGIRERVGIGFDADDMGGFLGSRPVCYLEKPIDPEELGKAVKELLGNRT